MQVVEVVLYFAVGQFAVDQVAELVVVIGRAVVGFQAEGLVCATRYLGFLFQTTLRFYCTSIQLQLIKLDECIRTLM